MPELNFAIEGAHAVEKAVVPTLAIELRITNLAPDSVQNVLLQSQIQIDCPRRRYQLEEKSCLSDLFGTPERWGETLRVMQWINVNHLVPAFDNETTTDIPVPCTFDFNVAATKFFYGLEEGDVPLRLLFSGTIFYRQPDGTLQVQQIPWSKEAEFRLPVGVWKQMMDLYYPNSAWLSLRKDIFDRLYEFKRQAGIATWEEALEQLLSDASNCAPVSDGRATCR